MDHLHDTGDDERIDTIYDEMESLGLDIINQMYLDGLNRNRPEQIDFDLNQISWTQIENKDDHNYGWLFTIFMRNNHIIPAQ